MVGSGGGPGSVAATQGRGVPASSDCVWLMMRHQTCIRHLRTSVAPHGSAPPTLQSLGPNWDCSYNTAVCVRVCRYRWYQAFACLGPVEVVSCCLPPGLTTTISDTTSTFCNRLSISSPFASVTHMAALQHRTSSTEQAPRSATGQFPSVCPCCGLPMPAQPAHSFIHSFMSALAALPNSTCHPLPLLFHCVHMHAARSEGLPVPRRLPQHSLLVTTPLTCSALCSGQTPHTPTRHRCWCPG